MLFLLISLEEKTYNVQLVAYGLYKMTSCFYFAGLDNLNYVE